MYWVEITSKIGCSNNCKYCPQSTLLSAYKSKIHQMSISSFNNLLKNVDNKTTQIHFSGFSEIFLHPEGHIFMAMAYQRGFEVCLFSTLVGFNSEKALFLKKAGVELTWARFHEFDGPNFNPKIFKDNCDLFKDTIPCPRYESSRVDRPISRGGSLWDPGYYEGAIECIRFFCNVLLPDGNIVLCCSDFGLKHPIGNLFNNHYDSLEFNLKREEYRTLAMTPKGSIICRSCEMAQKIQ